MQRVAGGIWALVALRAAVAVRAAVAAMAAMAGVSAVASKAVTVAAQLGVMVVALQTEVSDRTVTV